MAELLRRTFSHKLSTAVAAFGTQIDDPICDLDDIQVVLDDQNSIAGVHQGLQHIDQAVHISSVQLPVARRESSLESLIRCASPPESVGAG